MSAPSQMQTEARHYFHTSVKWSKQANGVKGCLTLNHAFLVIARAELMSAWRFVKNGAAKTAPSLQCSPLKILRTETR